VIGGWLFSAGAVTPDFGRSNPISGIARLFSVNSLAELGKAIAKSTVIGGIGYLVITHYKAEMIAMAALPLESSISYLGAMAISAFIYITAGMLIIVGIDVPFQLWEYYRKLKMTKEEVRQEMKESEGDPQLKGKIRSMQREMARKRMMSEVPKADVIVTNPTHYAVAIRYDETTMRTPRVVAKGTYLLATRIQEIASEHRIPILRTPPLARALYKYAELEAEIPVALFTAVAEVLAYVYQLRSFHTQGGTMPVLPEELSVPEGMDTIGEVE
jgi:flagellar biosynthetic protein FlhB